MVNLTIEGDSRHLHAIRDALELYMRCSLGQFKTAADLHNASWDDGMMAENAFKAVVTPDLGPNASYAIGGDKVSAKAKLCYELWKLLGGGTAGQPMAYSGVPLPTVSIENDDNESRIAEAAGLVVDMLAKPIRGKAAVTVNHRKNAERLVAAGLRAMWDAKTDG